MNLLNFTDCTPSPPPPCSHDYVSSLPEETFELDLVAEEKFHSLSVSVGVVKGVWPRGLNVGVTRGGVGVVA